MSARLDPDQLVELAELVVDGLAARLVIPRESHALVDAAAVAAHLTVERDWVYRHATQLGAVRVGEGARPRLRFDLAEVDRRLASCSGGRESDEPGERTVEPIRPRRRPRRLGTSPRLLPIRGADGA